MGCWSMGICLRVGCHFDRQKQTLDRQAVTSARQLGFPYPVTGMASGTHTPNSDRLEQHQQSGSGRHMSG